MLKDDAKVKNAEARKREFEEREAERKKRKEEKKERKRVREEEPMTSAYPVVKDRVALKAVELLLLAHKTWRILS